MKVAIVLIVAIASVNCGIRTVRQSGWPAPTTTTPGWSTPAPTQGWSSPPAQQGWGSTITNIDLSGAIAAAGSGWAAENHNEAVSATGAGGSGWGPSADIVISAGGESIVDQAGGVLQVTSQDSQQASSLNNVGVAAIAQGSEAEIVEASGLDVSNAQNGWAGASGESVSAAEGVSSLTVNPAAAALGAARP